eukprot:1000407-Prorocentrum_minimum.AAC.7
MPITSALMPIIQKRPKGVNVFIEQSVAALRVEPRGSRRREARGAPFVVAPFVRLLTRLFVGGGVWDPSRRADDRGGGEPIEPCCKPRSLALEVRGLHPNANPNANPNARVRMLGFTRHRPPPHAPHHTGAPPASEVCGKP